MRKMQLKQKNAGTWVSDNVLIICNEPLLFSHPSKPRNVCLKIHNRRTQASYIGGPAKPPSYRNTLPTPKIDTDNPHDTANSRIRKLKSAQNKHRPIRSTTAMPLPAAAIAPPPPIAVPRAR